MRRMYMFSVICLVALLSFATDVRAQEQESPATKAPHSFMETMHAFGLDFEVRLGLGALRGYTQYERGGSSVSASGQVTEYPSPLSRLEFPLDVSMYSLATGLKYKDRLNLNLELRKNMQGAAGKMEDSDWGYWYLDYDGSYSILHDPSPSTLDIYSESDADLDARVADAKLSFDFLKRPTWSVGAGLGFLYQYFSYDISDTTQWYPSSAYYFGTASDADFYSGEIITYDVSYYIPYLLAQGRIDVTSHLTLSADIAYAPYFVADDKDHHFIGISGTGSISETRYTGDALRYGLQCQGVLDRNWVLGLRYEHMKIMGDGDSEDYSGDGSVYRGKISQDLESIQDFMNITLTYSF